MKYHVLAFVIGFILDMILGDPYVLPHPIRLIGRLISGLEGLLLKEEYDDRKKRVRGMILAVTVVLCTLAVSGVSLLIFYHINKYVGMAAEAVMTYQILATKCLKVESMKVYGCLTSDKPEEERLADARKAVSMIVGRDTDVLDREGVIKAAVETVAENASDGSIAPMLYTALGGPVLGFCYKAINTMDSMIGYKNERYLYFGRTAAHLDDIVNFVPARISACLMIIAAFIGGKDLDGRQAVRIFKRDRMKHASPNSAQTESVCAGALGVRLAGDAVYFGKRVEKPYIGDDLRKIEVDDIRRANRLLYLSAWICTIICTVIMLVFCL
ncbi:MAG: adenosylcobinamide-phosphate synthase CbiB [Lachnospiraceae bacterium]|nr:adenosylcobinamide-phosphate synthase CbiB [Lachnospiraceae bacterium]